MKRLEALALGYRKYDADRPCRKNADHGYRRYTTSGACVGCATKAARDSYQREKRGGIKRLPPIPDRPVPKSAPVDGRYFTGVRCRRGHLAWRYARNGACVLCNREAQYRIKQHALNVIQSFRNLPGLVVWTETEPPPGLPGLIDRRTLGAAPTDHAPCFLRFHDTPGLLEVCRALGMVPIDEYVRTL